ncbi:MAG TPA: beta-1,6-N-acetylglucosaminyltransferase [Actinomycetes bacterium]|nr:beta-1,6-N-acetylglucosaminyltransferase [Actinomycetes bacterium]
MTVVAYHLETHRNPRQIERLVATLHRWAPDSPIVVSHDRNSEPLNEGAIERNGGVVLPASGGYSDMSHSRRWLSTVEWLEKHDVAYDWLSNLSGQDYPIRPLDQVHRELSESDADAFVETFDVFDEGETPWGTARGRTRYTFHHRRLGRLSRTQRQVLRPLQVVNRVQPWFRVTTATGLTVGRRVDAPWGGDLQLRGGSFFTTLRHRAVQHVRRFVDERHDVVDFLDGALAPAEVFFQTALFNGSGDPLAITNDCRRYFDFSETRLNHPRTLTRDDLPRVFASGKDFARKFDASQDVGLLDAVDTHLEQIAAGAVG